MPAAASAPQLLTCAMKVALSMAVCTLVGCRSEAGQKTTPTEQQPSSKPAPPASAAPSSSAPEPRAQPAPAVFGKQEDSRRLALGTSPIAEVELARGGRSVSFKLTLEDGSQGIYKPEQSFAANWYSELASYTLDRLLGLGRVPSAIGRRLSWPTLQATARQSKYVDEVVIQKDGSVRGALSWWIPGDLVPLSPPFGWEMWLRNEPASGPSPYQRRGEYLRAQKVPHKATFPREVPPPTFPDRAAELSDLVLFDFLTGNHDRWGGDFTNVRTLGEDGPLVAIDNANGFPKVDGADAHSVAKLEWLQRFRERTVRALERLELSAFEAALGQDPLAPLLNQAQLGHFEQRRQRTLEHIRRMQAKFGKGALPW